MNDGDGGHDPVEPSKLGEFIKGVLVLAGCAVFGYIVVHFIIKYW